MFARNQSNQHISNSAETAKLVQILTKLGAHDSHLMSKPVSAFRVA